MKKAWLNYCVYVLIKLKARVQSNSQTFHSWFDIWVQISNINSVFSFPTEGPNTIASVLLALRCRNFEDIQDLISFRQASKVSKPFLSVCLKGRSIWVSSAYKWKDTLRIEPRGNIYNEKRVGDNMDPWGTPQARGAKEETDPPIPTEKI